MNDFRTLKKNTQYTTKIVIINDIQKHNRMYKENSKFNKMFFKNDVGHVIQFTRFQLRFTTSFLIVKKYNQNARIELLRKNVLQIKNILHQRQSQFIDGFPFMKVIDYSFAK